MDSSVSLKDQIWFLRVCHHVLNELYHAGVVGGLYNGMVSCLVKVRFVDSHYPHLVNCSHAFWAQQKKWGSTKANAHFLTRNTILFLSWLLCDIAVDVHCGVSDVLAPMNHAELLCIKVAKIWLLFFMFVPCVTDIKTLYYPTDTQIYNL